MVKAALHVYPFAKSMLLARSGDEDATGTVWRTASSHWRKMALHALPFSVSQVARVRRAHAAERTR